MRKFTLQEVIEGLGALDPLKHNVETGSGGCTYRADNNGDYNEDEDTLPAPSLKTEPGCVVGALVYNLNRQLFISELAACGSSISDGGSGTDADKILAQLVEPDAHRLLSDIQYHADQHMPWGVAIKEGFGKFTFGFTI